MDNPTTGILQITNLYGKPLTEELLALLKSHYQAVRIVRWGEFVTLDYNPQRLNLYMSTDGFLVRHDFK